MLEVCFVGICLMCCELFLLKLLSFLCMISLRIILYETAIKSSSTVRNVCSVVLW